MDKRYQVFVSAPFAGRKDVRQEAMRTLMRINCLPAGMEPLPSAENETWDSIKKVIDDCDYYLLILGATYESLTVDGLSYSERKFDYAVERNLKIIALVHQDSDNLSSNRIEMDPGLRTRLSDFLAKVKDSVLVDFWMEKDELPGKIVLGMLDAIETHPATGWIRASQAANPGLLSEINDMKKENRVLQRALFYNQRPSRFRM